MNDWQALTRTDIKDFIKSHENADVRDLAFKKPPESDWPYPLILDQIKARQKAKTKIPVWLENDDVIFPKADVLEQASSSATAQYKASLAQGKTFTDLTGGAGIDSHAISNNFETTTIIDTDEDTANLIAHNMRHLSHKPVTVINDTAQNHVKTMSPVDCVFIDPQRRNVTRKGLYKLEDCSPNVFDLLPALKNKAKTILLKTSPMLDINQGIEQLKYVETVHIVEWQGECKEILFLLNPDTITNPIPITSVKLDNHGNALRSFTFTREDERDLKITITAPQKYLYEPGAAFMKSGSYNALAAQYGVSKLHRHTHLYTSQTLCSTFPGRTFEIENIYPAQAKALPFKKANLTIRNFPADIATLKKKLKLKDGGENYLFACTLEGEKHALIHAKKIDKN